MRTRDGRLARLVIRALQALRPAIGPLIRMIPQHVRARIRADLFGRGWGTSSSQLTGAGLPPPELLPGITLIGYPRAEFGMGESIRSMARAASSVRVPVETYNFTLHVGARQRDSTFDDLLTRQPTRRTNVFCINADLLAETMQVLGPAGLAGRYNILRPFWELPILPDAWKDSLQAMDEVWVATKFNQSAFSAAVDRPVQLVPMAVPLPSPSPLSRSHFNISPDTFVFAFSFDFASYVSRKNPQAVIDAFKLAFPDPAETGVALIIKMMGDGPGRQGALIKLRADAEADSRIQLVNRVWSRAEVDSFLWACDCYVSLHRSEGFGLGLAEAMSRGKPVIATDFSGTTDFVNATTGYPVPFNLIEVLPGDYPHYRSGQQWADPCLEIAARHMLRAYHQRDEALSIGRAARDFIVREHSPGKVGQIIFDRLKTLGLW